MCECSPSSSSPGASSTRRTASIASPDVIEKPNFWSSWAVAMYSWVCASTPAVTRTITRAGLPGLRRHRGEPVDLVEGVDDDPADARPRRRGAARRSSCCCRGSRSGPGRSRPAARRSARRPSTRRGRAPPRRPSGPPSCTGTPCRRRRRRSRRTPRGTPAARARKSASSRTYAGEPCSATRSRRSTPPTSSAPASFLRAVEDHSSGTSALTSAGARSQDGPRSAAVGVRPAGLVGDGIGPHIRSGAETPSRREAVGEHRAGRRRRAAAGPGGSVPAPRRPSAAPGRRRRTCGTSTAVSSR